MIYMLLSLTNVNGNREEKLLGRLALDLTGLEANLKAGILRFLSCSF